MDRREKIETIANFCGIVKPTKNVRNDDYRVAFNPFVSNDDAALVRRKVEERGWEWSIKQSPFTETEDHMRYIAEIEEKKGYGDTEYDAFNLALLAAIEAEGGAG